MIDIKYSTHIANLDVVNNKSVNELGQLYLGRPPDNLAYRSRKILIFAIYF